jgi:preprotein translocase subunit SecF
LEKVYNFIKYKYYFFGLSATLYIVFFAGTFLLQGGFKMGIDFAGGVKIIARFEQGVTETKIRSAIEQHGASVQHIGAADKNEFIITVKAANEGSGSVKQSDNIRKKLEDVFGEKKVVFQSVEDVGPAVGDILKMDALKALIFSTILMLVYLSFRFEFKYALGVLIAVIHDMILAVAFCGIMGIEMNIPIIAAILTIFGYSVNDTIIIFDRVRENMHIVSKKQSFKEVIDKSISQTLSRTLLTVLTVLISLMSIYLLGGEGLNDFATVMIFGLIFGTYSSYYIASPVVLAW